MVHVSVSDSRTSIHIRSFTLKYMYAIIVSSSNCKIEINTSHPHHEIISSLMHFALSSTQLASLLSDDDVVMVSTSSPPSRWIVYHCRTLHDRALWHHRRLLSGLRGLHLLRQEVLQLRIASANNRRNKAEGNA